MHAVDCSGCRLVVCRCWADAMQGLGSDAWGKDQLLCMMNHYVNLAFHGPGQETLFSCWGLNGTIFRSCLLAKQALL